LILAERDGIPKGLDEVPVPVSFELVTNGKNP
jgi:hypothetical protein